jgi:cyclophilin family peptidyl-prolyl cis-trans isomerase/tetratricopeptide (TPR) repeat protein
MRTRLGVFCDKVIEAGWLAAVIVVPLFFNIYSQRVFEPDKLSLLRSIALVMGVAWVIRLLEDWRLRSAEDSNNREETSLWHWIYTTPLALPTLLLLLVYLISTVASVVPRVSWWGSYQRLQGTYTTLSYIIIFFLAIQGIRGKGQFNRLINAMILVSFPIAMYGLIQHFGLDPLPWAGNVTTRVASNMGNAIFVAAFLIMVVPITLTRLLESWKATVGRWEARDGVIGIGAFALLAGTLLLGMLWSVANEASWVRWVALVVGLGLQAPIYLLTAAERRPRVLAISLPLTFAFLVGFSWVLEIFFPPVSPSYFWLGLAASLIFIIAMAAFAFYLRKPVARLLLLAAYFVILLAQLVCIFYSQSRGPLIGLLGGLFFYVVMLGLSRRRLWVPWLASAAAVAVAVFLIVFNTVDAPVVDSLRQVPYVGRLGQVLQTERGTGKVRILIWEGVVEMIGWHDPLETPGEGGGPDPLNIVRPLIGYGPESMYVAYNRFYPPDLAHYERRNASPDRSHNETFDALATTGAIGFVVYMALFGSIFYYGLKWLGLIDKRRQAFWFVGLWIGGGILGATVTWIWRGPLYVGLGVPLGTMVGLGLYVLGRLLMATKTAVAGGRGRSDLQDEAVGMPPLIGHYALWMIALLAAIVAHYLEIHFGIAIAATRTYFWLYAAMMVAIGVRLAPSSVVEESANLGTHGPATPRLGVTAIAAAAGRPASNARRASQQGKRTQTLAQGRSPARQRGWLGEILVCSLVALLVLSTMMYDYVTIQAGEPGVLRTIWDSLLQGQEAQPPVVLILLLITWSMIALISLSDLAIREQTVPDASASAPALGPVLDTSFRASPGQERAALTDDRPTFTTRDWLIALGTFALVSLAGTLIFSLLHTARLQPVEIGGPNPLANTFTGYLFLVIVVMAAMASVLTFMFQRQIRPWLWAGGLRDVVLLTAVVVLPLLAGTMIWMANVGIVRADILYKQGLSSEKVQDWDGAVYFYRQAAELAPDQDFYYLFLGRAYMEKAKSGRGEEREAWLQESERALQTARTLAPLNTDHSANLARLYRTWGGLSQQDRRKELFEKALMYYADATSLSPNNAQLFNEWGQTHAFLSESDRALDLYQHSLSLDSKYGQTYLLLGEYYIEGGDWEKALETYKKAVEVQPRSVDAHSALGYVYTQLGDLESALQAYTVAAELRPRSSDEHKNLAILYQQMGRLDDALREGREAMKLAPADQQQALQLFLAELEAMQEGLSAEDAQRVQKLLAKGSSEMNAEDWDAAEQTFEQVLQLSANNVQAHSALAYIFARQGRADEAIAENWTVIGLMPDDYNSFKNLALLYAQRGMIDEALSAAERAFELAPDEQREAVHLFIEQLTEQQADQTPPETSGGDQSGQRAGDLPPEERNGMYSTPPPMIIDPKKQYTATIATEKGDIVLELYADRAPNTVNNFVFLAREGFFDNTTFHRVLTGFMAQGGDPTGTGRGGPGYRFADEFHSTLRHSGPGMLSMANAGPNTNGSQFFITYDATPWLDDKHAVFGKVIEGMDVLQSLTPRDPQQNPRFAGDKILTVAIDEK